MKTIYGECVSGGEHAPVIISRLDRDGCDIILGIPYLVLGPDLTLWIGAIGPLPITTQPPHKRRASRLTARFAEPLEPAILDHFRG